MIQSIPLQIQEMAEKDIIKNDVIHEPEVTSLPVNILIKYIEYVKQFKPIMTVQTSDYLKRTYLKLRSSNNSKNTSPRILNTLVRTATAIARIHQKNIVEEADIDKTIRLVKKMLGQQGISIDEADTYLTRQFNRIIQILHDDELHKSGMTVEEILNVLHNEGSVEEIHKMIECCTDITDKVIILMFSSAGFRLESWDYFCWKDVIFFKDKTQQYTGAALRVYRGDPEEYWTFITPEACYALTLYKEEWKSRFLKYPTNDDPLIASTRFDVPVRLQSKGVRSRVDKIVTKIGLRDEIKKNQRRYEVKLDHGFRKYFNTMMRRAKVNYLDKEDMMGHKVGLEQAYERYQEEDFERFPEYQKAISFLTISDVERTKFENQQLKEERTYLERKLPVLVDEAIERIKKQMMNQGWKIPS